MTDQFSMDFATPEFRKKAVVPGVAYGPPEPVWRIPYPWGKESYRIPRGAILSCQDAGDGRTWLLLSRAAAPVLVDTPIETLRAAMPTLGKHFNADRVAA